MFTQNQFILYLICGLLVITYASIWQVQFSSADTGDAPPLSEAASQIQADNRSPDDQDLKQYKSDAKITTLIEPGLFELKIPEKFDSPPARDARIIQDAATNQSAQYTLFRYEAGTHIYEVGFVRFPDEIFQQKSTNQMLDDLRNGERERFKGMIRKEISNYTSQNLLRRELEIEAGGFDPPIFARTILLINRPYAFLVSFSSQSQSDLNSIKTNAYFDSFRVFRQPTNQTIIVNADTKPPSDPGLGSQLDLNSSQAINP
ncbi:MAG: hypothetical protein SFT81_05895 [Candidatus Caenarcaniphilales bacterium]|nr:hypothetical protein [Candidatus Caenarcaniphilales bacterium]